jgi:hypothetical protein
MLSISFMSFTHLCIKLSVSLPEGRMRGLPKLPSFHTKSQVLAFLVSLK